MSSAEPGPGVAPGLRERKKARTRIAIQRQAIRLFLDQGYAGTTVEQIAAAGVSPSTFFRYFPTKEDVVVGDDYDRLMLDAFRAQPRELTPVRAVRAVRAAIRQLARKPMARSIGGSLPTEPQPGLRRRLRWS